MSTATRDSKLTRARRETRLAVSALVGIAAYVLEVRPWLLSWGATREEADGPLLGDGLATQREAEMVVI